MSTVSADPAITRLVDSIAAIDDHAHPLPVGVEPEPDRDHPICPYDHPMPLRQRATNPEYIQAWRALWGYEHDDVQPQHLLEAIDAKQKIQAEQGDGYNEWVLDQVSIQTMLPVDYGPKPTLQSPRFRWLTHADWLMWPIGTTGPRDERLTGIYAHEQAAAGARAGLEGPPTTLDEYVTGILAPELARRKADGAVGLKFQTPYYRPIDFAEVTRSDAARLYTRGHSEGLPADEHRLLEDHLFHTIAHEAGALDLPIQMHTGHGAKPHFQSLGSNPLLMEPTIVAAPDTKFLMLHAGWPFDRQAVAALAHDNAYLDISCATVHLYAHNLAGIVRDALEWFPEKILYGTDAYSEMAIAMLGNLELRPNFLQGWEEKAWLMDRTARDALAVALTDMLHDRVIRVADVEELAHLVLRDNARKLYHV